MLNSILWFKICSCVLVMDIIWSVINYIRRDIKSDKYILKFRKLSKEKKAKTIKAFRFLIIMYKTYLFVMPILLIITFFDKNMKQLFFYSMVMTILILIWMVIDFFYRSYLLNKIYSDNITKNLSDAS